MFLLHLMHILSKIFHTFLLRYDLVIVFATQHFVVFYSIYCACCLNLLALSCEERVGD